MNDDGTGAGAAPPQDTTWDGELTFGSFLFDVANRTLTWTGEIFRIYGFEPSEVVPTLELLSAHQPPQDRERSNARFQRLLAVGGPFCWHYRIIDARQVARSVIATGEAVRDDDGTVAQVRGVLVDLTETLRRHQAAETARAVEQSAATRATIDQAKGVLMACFDLTDAQAFDLLRLHSSYANVKLRDVAATLVERLTDRDLISMPARLRVASILNALANGRVPDLPAPASAADPQPAAERVVGARAAAPQPQPAAVALSPDFPVATLVHAIDDAGLSITIADCLADDYPLVYVNEAFVELTGYAADQVLGRNCRFLQGADTEPAEVAAMRSGLSQGQEVRTVVRNYRQDGRPFWNELHISAVRDDTGRLTHYIGYQVDVSERVERERQLHQLAYYDAGSGLPNLAHAMLHLESLIAEAAAIDVVYIGLPATPSFQRTATDPDLSLTTVLARRLRAALNDNAMVAKLDGDAFLVIQPGPEPDLMDQVPAAIGEHIIAPAGSGRLAIRIGRAGYPDDGVSATELIALAQVNAG
jgi:PAS domain S-box-containing protein